MEQLSLSSRDQRGRPKNGPIPIRHCTTTVLVSSAHSLPKFAHMLVGVLFILQMIGWPQKESHCMCANRPNFGSLFSDLRPWFIGRTDDTKAVFIPGEQLPSDVLKALLHGREDLPHLGGSQVSVKDTK